MESPEEMSIQLLSKQLDSLSSEMRLLRNALFGDGSKNYGIDTSIELLRQEIEILKDLDNDLDLRIYQAITKGFCKAISSWCESHVIESALSIIGAMLLFFYMMMN